MASKPHFAQGPVISLLLAATLWGVIWYPLRVLDQHGLNGLWSSVVSYGVALLAGALYAWRYRLNWRKDAAHLALLALAAGWCNVAFVIAVIDGTVVRVLLLFYLSPVWSVLRGAGCWASVPRVGAGGCRRGAGRRAGHTVGRRAGLPWPQVAADWLALSSGFALRCRMYWCGICARFRWLPRPSFPGPAWCWCAGVDRARWPCLSAYTTETVSGAAALGLFGIVIMTLAVQYGVTHMPVHRSAVILLFEVVIGAVSSQWLAQEVIGGREIIGGVLILVAGYFAARAHVD